MLAGAFHIPRAGCLRIDAIHLIPAGAGVVSHPIVHLVAGFVKHLPHIWAEGCPWLPKKRTPAPAVRPHQLESWEEATCDWIKKESIIKQVPCPLIRDASNIEYPYVSTDVLREESLYRIPIQRQVSIYNQCRHPCPSLPLSFAAAIWCHRCQLKMNLHPKR